MQQLPLVNDEYVAIHPLGHWLARFVRECQFRSNRARSGQGHHLGYGADVNARCAHSLPTS